MLTRVCKMPRTLADYWEQYGSLGDCLARLVHEGQDIMYVPRMLNRDDCNCNKYIHIDDETTETMVEMGKYSQNLANVFYYYQQMGYPETAGWEKDPLYIRKKQLQFSHDIFAITSKIDTAAKHWPEYEDIFAQIIETLRGLQYAEK